MKTSVIEVHDMLSVLSVDDLEKRIGEVPGVESATVNYAAGNATVRYDETRLDVAEIKSGVRQGGYETDLPAAAPAGDGHEEHTTADSPPATPAPADPPAPEAVPPKPPDAAPPDANAAPTSAPDDAPPADDENEDQTEPDKV